MEAEEQLHWVSKDWTFLARITHQSDEMCFAALKLSSEAMQHIKKPTAEMAKIAVEKSSKAIRWVPVELRTEAMWMGAVQRDGLALLHACARDITHSFDRPLPPIVPGSLATGVTPAVVCAAVTQNCEALRWVIVSDENIDALRSCPAMAKMDVFKFIFLTGRRDFSPPHVLEKFLNLEGVAEKLVKPVMSLLVRKKNTALLVRFIRARHWSAATQAKWVSTALRMVRGQIGLDGGPSGKIDPEFSRMVHALKTLGANQRAMDALAEMDSAEDTVSLHRKTKPTLWVVRAPGFQEFAHQ